MGLSLGYEKTLLLGGLASHTPDCGVCAYVSTRMVDCIVQSVWHKVFAKVNLRCQYGVMVAPENTTLLAPAIAAARKVLDDLEFTDTPAVLRKIKTSSARTLPPPLAKSLLHQLDSDEWLRSKVAEARDWDLASDDPAEAASSLYVARPEEWEQRLATLVEEHLALVKQSDSQGLRVRVAKLERELSASRSKLRSATKHAKLVEKDLAAERRSAKARVTEVQKAERSGDRTLAAKAAELEQALSVAQVELAESRKRGRRLRSELLKARRARPERSESGARTFGGQDPASLARVIDDLAASARPDAVIAPAAPGERAAFGLPAGVAPDNRAAIDWLLGRENSTTLVVDGYNVTWQQDGPNFSSKEARQDLITRLGQLRKRAKGQLRIVAVFDSEFGTVQPVLGAPVDVVFVEWADEEVRRLAKTTAGDVVVISTDREVQDGSQASGALVLWSEAFTHWR